MPLAMMVAAHRRATVTVLLVYLALAVTWSYVIPLGGGIDEPRHLRYIQIVAEEYRLPTPAEKAAAISHHPPLHYLLAAPVYIATSGMGRDAAWHALRLQQVALGAGVLLLVFATIRRLVPEHPWAAVVAMAGVGLLPHFLLICAIVSNDITVTLAATVTLYLAVRAVVEPEGRVVLSALAGLSAGAAVLSKMSGLTIVPPVLLALTVAPLINRGQDAVGESEEACARPRRSPRERALISALAFTAPCALTAGTWIGHYLSVWGRLDSDPPWPEYTWPVHTFGAKLLRAIDGLYRSTWVQVGWLPGPHSSPPLQPSGLWPRPDLETPILLLTVPLALVGLVGTIALTVRWLRAASARPRGLALGMLWLAWGLTYAAVAYSAIYTNPGRFEAGRYALHAVGATVAMLVLGPMILPRRWMIVCWVGLLALLVVMNGVSFWEMYAYLIPTFAP